MSCSPSRLLRQGSRATAPAGFDDVIEQPTHHAAVDLDLVAVEPGS
jgi:hypothetical protein